MSTNLRIQFFVTDFNQKPDVKISRQVQAQKIVSANWLTLEDDFPVIVR
jgi:hypothetical protein